MPSAPFAGSGRSSGCLYSRPGLGRDQFGHTPVRVHLIAYNATPQTTPVQERPYVLPGLIEDAPMFRASIGLRDSLRSAKALNRSTQVKKRGNRVELAVADIYEVIQCRY